MNVLNLLQLRLMVVAALVTVARRMLLLALIILIPPALVFRVPFRSPSLTVIATNH